VDADSALQMNATSNWRTVGNGHGFRQHRTRRHRLDATRRRRPATTMTSLSLNGRSYTDLLSIQPGVIPTTTIQSNSVIMAGVTGPVAPSGGLIPASCR